MDEQSSSPGSHRGRARERQQRRQARKQHVRQVGVSRPPRQTMPTGGFKPPKLRIPAFGRRLMYGIGGALFLIGVIVVLGLFKNSAPEVDPNALWLGTEYTYESPSDEAVEALVQRLRENRIGTVYAWVSWLKPDNTWSGIKDQENEFTEVEENVKTFVAQFKKAYPEVRLYGWVGVPTNVTAEVRLEDETVQQTVTDFSSKVVTDLGFDGVFLDVEPVWDGDESFLNLLRQVRLTLPENIPIGVAVPPDWSPANTNIPVPAQITPGTEWKKEYKKNVALLVDDMAVMAYSSSLATSADYVLWMAYQVQAFAEAFKELGMGETGTRLLIGIPTYIEELPGHDPNIESVPAAIQGVRLGMEQAGAAAEYVEGLAIYAEWDTDIAEWEQYKTEWVETP